MPAKTARRIGAPATILLKWARCGMNRNGTLFDRLVLVSLIVFTVFVLGFFLFTRLRPAAPRAAEVAELPVIGPVPEFTLTNQLGRAATLASLRGQAWVGDIIFTRCSGPCPKMTRRMSEVAAAVPAGLPVKFITLTTDPEYDQPRVLNAYAVKYGADAARWQFLTGPKLEIAKVAADGLKLTALAKKPEERTADDDLFIHSTIFVVVDKQGRLRGAFQQMGDDINPDEARQKVVAAVETLAREP